MIDNFNSLFFPYLFNSADSLLTYYGLGKHLFYIDISLLFLYAAHLAQIHHSLQLENC